MERPSSCRGFGLTWGTTDEVERKAVRGRQGKERQRRGETRVKARIVEEDERASLSGARKAHLAKLKGWSVVTKPIEGGSVDGG